jgi:hypothetical protein
LNRKARIDPVKLPVDVLCCQRRCEEHGTCDEGAPCHRRAFQLREACLRV